MDGKDRSIATQVAFKAATDLAVRGEFDLATAEGQARFEEIFSHLTESLISAIEAGQSADERMAQVIQGEFPGSQVVNQNPGQNYGPPSYTTPPLTLTIKGAQYGPLPDWLYEAAAKSGITEVYDNRKDASGTTRPWFRATTGGKDAKAFWPPRNS